MFYGGLKLLVAAFIGLAGVLSSPLLAAPLNEWKISCSVDRGTIKRRGDVWTFRTSDNRCPNGSWQQRAEIRSRDVSPKTSGAYLFQTNISMTTRRREKFDIFQIHDGRNGCAPPLKITVLENGRIELISDVKKKSGKGCRRGKLSRRPSRGKIRRDGTEQELKVLIEFNGRGGFDATVWIDGVQQIRGRYRSPKSPWAYRSNKFYFKHGVYSRNIFDYELVSRGMSVRRVKVGR